MFYAGDVLNDTYKIIEPIGKGGLGTIYKAWHLRLSTEVVIKLLDHSGAADFNAKNEADILKRLRHTYLPQVYDYVTIGNEVYTVIDYIPGTDLQHYLDTGYRFTGAELYKWFCQLCEALQYLHTQNPPIIHSDIKPANIMIKPDGDICLIDFNVSLAENADALKGISQEYASPEQYRQAQAIMNGEDPSRYPIDVRTDIYSLGATFYHLMTYITPTWNPAELVPITEYELPYADSFVEIIAKAMSANPNNRYQSCARLQKVLERIPKQDKRVKHLSFIRLVTNVLLIALLTVGIITTYYGYCMIQVENFDKAYKKYLTLAEGVEEPQKLLALGKDVLERQDARMSLNRDMHSYYRVYLNGANAYRELGEYAKAQKYYETILSVEEPDIYYEYALYQIEKQEYAEATAALTKAIRFGLTQGEAYYLKGMIAEKKGDSEDAVLQYRKAAAQLRDGKIREAVQERLDDLGGESE